MSMGKQKKGTNKLPFAKILKRLMEERQLTVRAIAEMAGVSSSVVQSWLNQAIPHDLQAVAKLAQALGLSFKGLLLGESETINHAITPAEFFDESDLFEGICKVSIKKLTPRKGG